MPSITISQLRNTRRIKRWLRAGKTIELRDRQQVIARIIPACPSPQSRSKRPQEWPDFAALRQQIFGDRILPGADLVVEERGRY